MFKRKSNRQIAAWLSARRCKIDSFRTITGEPVDFRTSPQGIEVENPDDWNSRYGASWEQAAAILRVQFNQRIIHEKQTHLFYGTKSPWSMGGLWCSRYTAILYKKACERTVYGRSERKNSYLQVNFLASENRKAGCIACAMQPAFLLLLLNWSGFGPIHGKWRQENCTPSNAALYCIFLLPPNIDTEINT